MLFSFVSFRFELFAGDIYDFLLLLRNQLSKMLCWNELVFYQGQLKIFYQSMQCNTRFEKELLIFHPID